jgi:hypothetical protein
VYLNATTLQSCQYQVLGSTPGFWDIVVTNPNSQKGILPRGFQIIAVF